MNIVSMIGNTPKAGTFLIAKGFERQHKHVIKLITAHVTNFEKFGNLKLRKVTTKGRPVEEYLLNEEQTMLLGTLLRNSPVTVEFKTRIIVEFKNIKQKLQALEKHKQSTVYGQVRDAGKIVRLEAVSEMARFRDYATSQGSTRAKKYFMVITKMMNGLLFIVEEKYDNLRNVMTTQQLMTASSAEQIIMKGLTEGMNKKMFYKDIFQDVKKRVMLFADLHGRTEVIQAYLDAPEDKPLINDN